MASRVTLVQRARSATWPPGARSPGQLWLRRLLAPPGRRRQLHSGARSKLTLASEPIDQVVARARLASLLAAACLLAAKRLIGGADLAGSGAKICQSFLLQSSKTRAPDLEGFVFKVGALAGLSGQDSTCAPR